MPSFEQMARDAGFLTQDDMLGQSTCSDPDKVPTIGDMDIVTTPLMPEGFIGLRNDKGCLVRGPSGKMWWVDFGLPEVKW